jgi:hypothetical protein
MPYKNPEDKKAQMRRYYERKRENYKKARKSLIVKKRNYILELKKQPCTDCGKCYPYYVMDFDHLRDKLNSVSKMKLHSWTRLKEEIAKCELVCSNCHRIRTYNRHIPQ